MEQCELTSLCERNKALLTIWEDDIYIVLKAQ